MQRKLRYLAGRMELSSSLSRGWSKLAPVTLVALLQRDTQWGGGGSGGAGEVKWRSDVGNGKKGGKKEAARAAGERRIDEGRRKRPTYIFSSLSFSSVRGTYYASRSNRGGGPLNA